MIGHYVGIPLLYERFLVLDRWTALRHLLVLGPSGSGKSRSIFLINCYYNRQTSFVATDPKSELWSHTAAKQANAIRFAPSDPDNSMSFNFVPFCKDTAIADRLTDAIIYAQGKRHGDVYWENAERQLLKVLLIHAAHSETPVLTFVYELICADHQVLSKILTASPVATVRREARPYIEGTEHYRTGAKSGVKQKLKWLDNEKIRRFTSSTKEAFDFSVLRRVPTQIYWCLEEDDVTRLQQLTAVFFNLMLSVLKRAEGNVPVNLFFDEFGNIGRLNDFEKDITLLRGRDITIIAGLQSHSQLEVLYGKAEAEIIYDNFNSKIVMGGLEGEMAERLSRAMGEYTHREKKKSYSRQGGLFSPQTSVTESEHFYERRLMKPQEIRQLNPKKLLLLATSLSPIILDRLRFEEKPQALNKHRCPKEIAIENLADRKPPKPKPRDPPPPPPLPQGLLPKK
ncbi:MAG: type IV secretory system conjugative DNA transfer family protein [Acidobacteria bacterium]|nr:type IV secretory system conjugative DNA transfer family protein [Acidobacteriota bacterium]